MEIRSATSDDIPAIVALLKASLGESLLPKSEAYWRWKHIDNPFGESPVLLFCSGDQIVGVRAFMRWQWSDGSRFYNAVRAVDTATHPQHQGKGIFKKLTLALVQNCKEAGDHLVFNTPNNQSRPGYLKMGWREVGKLPVCVHVARPVRMAAHLLFKQKQTFFHDGDQLMEHWLNHPGLDGLIERHRSAAQGIITSVSKSYLYWRYVAVPVVNYLALGEERDGKLIGLLVGRLKVTKLGKEFRITECLCDHTDAFASLLRALRKKVREWQFDYISWSGSSYSARGLRFNAGPIVTVRELATQEPGATLNFTNWSPSLGDLELF